MITCRVKHKCEKEGVFYLSIKTTSSCLDWDDISISLFALKDDLDYLNDINNGELYRDGELEFVSLPFELHGFELNAMQ